MIVVSVNTDLQRQVGVRVEDPSDPPSEPINYGVSRVFSETVLCSCTSLCDDGERGPRILECADGERSGVRAPGTTLSDQTRRRGGGSEFGVGGVGRVLRGGTPVEDSRGKHRQVGSRPSARRDHLLTV